MTYVSPFLVGIFPFWDLDSGARDTTRRIRPETLSRARAPANSAPAGRANTPFFRPTAFCQTSIVATTGPARAETDRTRLNERCSEHVRFDRSHVRYVEAGRAQWARRWSCARPCESL